MKITTCNIRFCTMPGDLDSKSWEQRKSLCATTIIQTEPDIICLQECHNIQFDYIKMILGPDWDAFWMMSYTNGEYPENAIFFRKNSIKVVTYGGYYLSETPHIPGSKSWGSECSRFANFIVLDTPEGRCRIINTHMDHASQSAREHQAKILFEESAQWPDKLPQILTGDLNCDIHNPAVQFLIANGWRDSFFEATGIMEPGFTFHGFSGEKWHGDMGVCGNGKMDWILLRGPVSCTDSQIIKDHDGDIFPSDHYFITAKLKL